MAVFSTGRWKERSEGSQPWSEQGRKSPLSLTEAEGLTSPVGSVTPWVSTRKQAAPTGAEAV